MDISVFNDKFYTFYHKDLNFLQDKPIVEIYSHYILHGQKEHRKVIDPLLDESYLKNSNLSYGEYNYIKHKDVPKCNMMKNISSLIDHMQKNKQDFTKTKYVDSKDLNLSDLNSQKKYDIILVNHETSLTGAPIYLYSLYKQLKKNKYKVLLVDMFYNKEIHEIFDIVSEDAVYYLDDLTLLRKIILSVSPKAIYCNSISWTYPYLLDIQTNYNIIFHSHEHSSAYLFHFGPEIKSINNLLCVSKNISKDFKEKLGVNACVCPPFLSHDILQNKLDNLDLETTKITNGYRSLDKKRVIIGMSGDTTSRKNFREFLISATNYPEKEFLWIGGDKNTIIDSINNEPLPKNFFHISHTNNPYKYFKIIDYFILFSLFDPCPYVVIENLYLNNFVIVFKDNISYQYDSSKMNNFYSFNGNISTDNISYVLKNICKNKVTVKDKLNNKYVMENFINPTISDSSGKIKMNLIDYLGDRIKESIK